MSPHGRTRERSTVKAHRPVVLVVDDEAAIRESLRRVLEEAGYRVREAATVDAALDALRETVIDAVILDLRMPDERGLKRSGLEVLAYVRLHAELAQIPVLILTGYIPNEEEEETIRRHRASVFHKPEGHATLVHHLDRLTARTDRQST